MSPLCELLAWDTRFFGVRIARILGQELDELAMKPILDWSEAKRIDCLYFLADAASEASIAVAEQHGFGLKDVRVTYERRLSIPLDKVPPLPAGSCIRSARLDDIVALECIAASCFTDSRFSADSRFPRTLVSALYRVWIRQSVEGQADMVLVLENAGRAAGFITGKLLDERTGQIPLAGLDAAVQGHGLAQALYAEALRWFASQGIDAVTYVTQARNIRAQRVIQRLDFLSRSTHLWYHKWFDRREGES